MWKVGGSPLALQPRQADNLLNLIIERSVSTAAARRRCLCKIQLFMHYSNFGAVVQIGNSPHLLHTTPALCGDGLCSVFSTTPIIALYCLTIFLFYKHTQKVALKEQR